MDRDIFIELLIAARERERAEAIEYNRSLKRGHLRPIPPSLDRANAMESLYPQKRRRRSRRNKLHNRARNILHQAIAEGLFERPTQRELCGSAGPIDAHHVDYEKPLDVVFLRLSCHSEEHPELPKRLFESRRKAL